MNGIQTLPLQHCFPKGSKDGLGGPGLLCFRQDGAHDASIAAQLIPLIDAESDLCTGGGAHLPSSLVEGSNDHCEEHLLNLRVSQVFGK